MFSCYLLTSSLPAYTFVTFTFTLTSSSPLSLLHLGKVVSFSEITFNVASLFQTFLIPLERYLTGLMPLARTISPYRAPPKVKPFNTDDFIRSLEQNGPQLTSKTKGDWPALYRRFLKSPNFVGWYNARHSEVSTKLSLLHLECLSEAKIEIWMEGKAEVELVDMVLRCLVPIQLKDI